MKPTQILPTIIILIDIGAAIVYGCHKDLRNVGYWLSAAAISIFVTY